MPMTEAIQGDDFYQTITKKIKKLNKKLEKIATHEETYNGKKMPEEIQKMLSHKHTYTDKLKTYKGVIDLYHSVKTEKAIPRDTKESKPINTQTEHIEEEELITSLVQFILACNISRLSEDKALPINIESFLSKQHLSTLKKLWNSTFQIPSKFTLGAWKKQTLELIKLFTKKSTEKVLGEDITYKALSTKLYEVFKEEAFINTDVDCEQKPVELKKAVEEKKEPKIEMKPTEDVKPIDVKKYAKPSEVKPVEVKVKETKSADLKPKEEKQDAKANDWAEAMPEPEKLKEVKKSEEDDEWIESKPSRARKNGKRRSLRRY